MRRFVVNPTPLNGPFSEHFFVDNDQQDQFATLLSELEFELKPVGRLEVAFVERIVVALWRQRRLTIAEGASIRLSHRLSLAPPYGRTFPGQRLGSSRYSGQLAQAEASFRHELQMEAIWPQNCDLPTRYQTMIDNQLYKTLQEYRQLQDRRLTTIDVEVEASPKCKSMNGSESFDHAKGPNIRAIARPKDVSHLLVCLIAGSSSSIRKNYNTSDI